MFNMNIWIMDILKYQVKTCFTIQVRLGIFIIIKCYVKINNNNYELKSYFETFKLNAEHRKKKYRIHFNYYLTNKIKLKKQMYFIYFNLFAFFKYKIKIYKGN